MRLRKDRVNMFQHMKQSSFHSQMTSSPNTKTKSICINASLSKHQRISENSLPDAALFLIKTNNSISSLSVSPDLFTYAGKKSLINATKRHPDAKIQTLATYSPSQLSLSESRWWEGSGVREERIIFGKEAVTVTRLSNSMNGGNLNHAFTVWMVNSNTLL